jgi:hypothetical protein
VYWLINTDEGFSVQEWHTLYKKGAKVMVNKAVSIQYGDTFLEASTSQTNGTLKLTVNGNAYNFPLGSTHLSPVRLPTVKMTPRYEFRF